MLASTEPRCAGFVTEADHTRCTRRFECARFAEPEGVLGPLAMSLCGAGVDAFKHAANVAQPQTEGNPYAASHPGVLAVNTVNTTSESA